MEIEELERHYCKICLYCEYLISSWVEFEKHLKKEHEEEINNE